MRAISILIVEDECIIAEDIKNQLNHIGYQVTDTAMSYNAAIDKLNKNLPDLVLIDIKLKGVKDGIDLAQTIKKNYHLPIVFLTSYSDKGTVKRVTKVSPEGYLVKPVDRDDLFTTIELAFSNFINSNSPQNDINLFDEGSQVSNDCIFVRKDHLLIKIRFEELKWIKAELNYLELHCVEKNILTRSTLKDFLQKLPPSQFIQVHRSYAINLKYVKTIEYTRVTIDKEEIPIGRSYLQALKDHILKKE